MSEIVNLNFGRASGNLQDPRLLPAGSLASTKKKKTKKLKSPTTALAVNNVQVLYNRPSTAIRPRKEYLASPSLGPNTSEDIDDKFVLAPLNPICSTPSPVVTASTIAKNLPEMEHKIVSIKKDILAQCLNLKFFQRVADVIRTNIDCNTMAHLLRIMRLAILRSNLTLSQMIEAKFFDILFQYFSQLKTQPNTKRYVFIFICECIITMDPCKRCPLFEWLSPLVSSIKSEFMQKNNLTDRLMGLDTLIALQKATAFDSTLSNQDHLKQLMEKNKIPQILNSLIMNPHMEEIRELTTILANANDTTSDIDTLLYAPGFWPLVRARLALFDSNYLLFMKQQLNDNFPEKLDCLRVVYVSLSHHINYDTQLIVPAFEEGMVDLLLDLNKWGLPANEIIKMLLQFYAPIQKANLTGQFINLLKTKSTQNFLFSLENHAVFGPKMTEKQIHSESSSLSLQDKANLHSAKPVETEKNEKLLIDFDTPCDAPVNLQPEVLVPIPSCIDDLLGLNLGTIVESNSLISLGYESCEAKSRNESDSSIEIPFSSPAGTESGLASEDELVKLIQTLNLTPSSPVNPPKTSPELKKIKPKLDWSIKAENRFVVPDLEATCNCDKPIKSDSVQTEEFSKMLVTLLQAANATWDKCPKCLAAVLDYGTSRLNKPLGDFLGFHFARSLGRVNELMPDEVRPLSDLLEALMEQNHFFFRAFIDDSDRFIKFVSLAQSHEESRRAMRDLVYKSIKSARPQQLKNLLESNMFAQMSKLIPTPMDITDKFLACIKRLIDVIPQSFVDLDVLMAQVGSIKVLQEQLRPTAGHEQEEMRILATSLIKDFELITRIAD